MKIKNIFIEIKDIVIRKKYFFIIAVSVIIICSTAIIILSDSSYNFSKQIKSNAEIIPADVKYFLEIIHPEKVIKTLPETELAKNIKSSKKWNNLLAVPEIMKIRNILYILETKSGQFINMDSIPDFLDGPLGIAYFKNRSILVTAKINVKSKISIKLLTLFAGKNIEKKDNAKNKTTFADIFVEEMIKSGDINISQISLDSQKIFITIINNYLLLTDNLDTLKNALAAASEKGKNNLYSLNGMKKVYNSADKDSIIFYQNNIQSFMAPFWAPLSTGKGTAFIFNIKKDELLNANIYNINFESENKQQNSKYSTIAWEEKIDQENIISLYSKTGSYSSLYKFLNSLADEWAHFSSGIKQFTDDADIDPEKYFTPDTGFAFIINNLDFNNYKIYPNFSLGYSSKISYNKLPEAIFKIKRKQDKNFQNKKYIQYRIDNNSYYRPALIEQKNYCLFSSSGKKLQDIISAQNGNQPVLKDLESFNRLDDYKESPHHLIINIQQFIKSLKNFYYYGAARSDQYSTKTIDRDVIPLFEVFKNYKTIHIAFGKPGVQSGKMVVTGN